MERVVTRGSRGIRLGYESSVVVKVGDDGSLGGGGCGSGGGGQGRTIDGDGESPDPLGQAIRLGRIIIIMTINTKTNKIS